MLVFAMSWLLLRMLLRLAWRPLRLGRMAPAWKSYDYVWLLILVIALLAVTLDNRRANLRAELVRLNAVLQAGVFELESRIARMELRCLATADRGQPAQASIHRPQHDRVAQNQSYQANQVVTDP